MRYIFNLWLNIMNGRPVTFTMSGLPFRTPLALAHLKKDCFIRHIFLRLAWRHNSQGHSNIWGRGGDWIADAPPLKSTPTQPFYFLGKERGEKTLFFPHFFFKAVSEKAWEQSLQGFRNIVSVCRMKSLAAEWENERPFYQSQAQWEGGRDKVKEFTTSH